MEEFPIQSVDPSLALPQLKEIPEPPQSLYMRGTLKQDTQKKYIAVVGSRKCTQYGKVVCQNLINGLRGYPVVIVSGLALGIDSVAHESALDAGLTTFAFPGSGIDWRVLYPAQHQSLAKRILSQGGVLLSEYEPKTRAAPWTFPKRNRIMAGVADMVLVIEAEEKSGTLITARLATEYNKIVGAVPGPITTPASNGTNWLLKMGAVPITESADIIRELGLSPITDTESSHKTLFLTAEETRIMDCLREPKSRDDIIRELSLDPSRVQIILSALEIKGVIKEILGRIERIM